MRTLEDILDQFAYHPATEDTAPKHAAIRDEFADFAERLWGFLPSGPEKTLVFRELQKAQMYANLCVALTAPADTSPARSVARVLPEGRRFSEVTPGDAEVPAGNRRFR